MNTNRAESSRAFFWLATLILGGLFFAAGVMVGRSLTMDNSAASRDRLSAIDERDSRPVEPSLTFPKALSENRNDFGFQVKVAPARPLPEGTTIPAPKVEDTAGDKDLAATDTTAAKNVAVSETTSDTTAAKNVAASDTTSDTTAALDLAAIDTTTAKNRRVSDTAAPKTRRANGATAPEDRRASDTTTGGDLAIGDPAIGGEPVTGEDLAASDVVGGGDLTGEDLAASDTAAARDRAATAAETYSAIAPKSQRLYCIQVAAFRELLKAEKHAALLRGKGFANVSTATALVEGQGTWHRVRVGKFTDREKGERYKRSQGLVGLLLPCD